jgi:GDP-4-dehydro-6-deoxy-D-mannose reductase
MRWNSEAGNRNNQEPRTENQELMDRVNTPVLVTGASGFVGGHLIDLLRRSHDVVGWGRSEQPAGFPGAAWRRIDLQDRAAVAQALRDLRPGQVYHLAGASQVARSWSSPVEPLAANVLATHHLLDGLRRSGHACRVLVTGSAAVYAPSLTPIAESAPIAPDSPYAVSKLAQEMLCVRAVVEDGVDAVVTRSFNHTGPRQLPEFVASSVARQIALIERGGQEPVIRVGNLDPRRDLTDVRDVVRAYVDLMQRGVSGETYNVASGVARSVREVVDALVAHARVPVRVEADPALVRPVDNPVLSGDASRLRSLTGWVPQIPFEQTVLDLLNYWRHAA